MGSFSEFGRTLGNGRFDVEPEDRNAAITGTGWPGSEKLKQMGFQLETAISFEKLGILIQTTSGHEGKFLIGTWHGQNIVISSGRVHLYQNDGRYGDNSPLRQWLGALMALMGNGNRIITTSTVGGQGDGIEDGMIVMPTMVHAIDVPTPHLTGDEFTSPETLLRDPDQQRANHFKWVAQQAGLKFRTGTGHRLIHGRRFGNKLSRQVYLTEGCQTVGMSMVPVLDAVDVENWSRPDDNKIKVMPVLYVTDAHDYPDHHDIKKRAVQDAPKLAKFLDLMVQTAW